MSETMASRAILIFCTDPRMWILLSKSSVCERPSGDERGGGGNSRVGEDYTCPTGVLD